MRIVVVEYPAEYGGVCVHRDGLSHCHIVYHIRASPTRQGENRSLARVVTGGGGGVPSGGNGIGERVAVGWGAGILGGDGLLVSRPDRWTLLLQVRTYGD